MFELNGKDPTLLFLHNFDVYSNSSLLETNACLFGRTAPFLKAELGDSLVFQTRVVKYFFQNFIK